MEFWNKQHEFLTPIVAKVHQNGPWGRALDGQPWRAAGMDFWNKQHGFLAPIVSKSCQIGSWEQAVDGRPWRAAGMNFWNKRHEFLALTVSEVRQSGLWGRAVDGRPWRAAGMNFWNKRHEFFTPIVSSYMTEHAIHPTTYDDHSCNGMPIHMMNCPVLSYRTWGTRVTGTDFSNKWQDISYANLS